MFRVEQPREVFGTGSTFGFQNAKRYIIIQMEGNSVAILDTKDYMLRDERLVVEEPSHLSESEFRTLVESLLDGMNCTFSDIQCKADKWGS